MTARKLLQNAHLPRPHANHSSGASHGDLHSSSSLSVRLVQQLVWQEGELLNDVQSQGARLHLCRQGLMTDLHCSQLVHRLIMRSLDLLGLRLSCLCCGPCILEGLGLRMQRSPQLLQAGGPVILRPLYEDECGCTNMPLLANTFSMLHVSQSHACLRQEHQPARDWVHSSAWLYMSTQELPEGTLSGCDPALTHLKLSFEVLNL